jgi:lipopolysaccharide export system permease protein
VIRATLIDRYVFREIFVSFLFCFAVFLVTGLIAGFLPLLQKGMESGLGVTVILFQLLIHALPGTLVTILPLSLTIGILLGLGRLAADNEIAALKSAGVSILRLLPPVLLLGLLGLGLALICTLYLIPRGISEGRRLTQEALLQRPDAGIEEHTFFDSLKDVILYVDRIDPESATMEGVFIRQSSDPEEIRTIIAKKGKSQPDPEGKAFVLLLVNGTILQENRQGEVKIGTFEKYTFRYPLKHASSPGSESTFEELSISQIRQRVKALMSKPPDRPDAAAYQERVRRMARILVIQRFIHPLACLALAIAAFPLGVINMGRSRLNNVSLGLVAIFVYYTLTLATERAARSGLAPPELVIPIPPVVFMAAASYLIRRARLESLPGLVIAARKAILQARGQMP